MRHSAPCGPVDRTRTRCTINSIARSPRVRRPGARNVQGHRHAQAWIFVAAGVRGVRRCERPALDHQRPRPRTAEPALEAAGERPGDRRPSLRPSAAQGQLPHVAHDRRARRAAGARLHRRRHRRRGHRLGHHHLARRPDQPIRRARIPYGNQRVSAFVDFVNGRTTPYDDDGHGTHVAGIIAGNGYDSNGQKAGIAPDASLVVLKVLDGNGQGTISNIIAALDWVLAQPHAVQHPRRQHVGRRGDHRVGTGPTR